MSRLAATPFLRPCSDCLLAAAPAFSHGQPDIDADFARTARLRYLADRQDRRPLRKLLSLQLQRLVQAQSPAAGPDLRYGRFTELYELNRLHLEADPRRCLQTRSQPHAQRAENRRRIRKLHGYGDSEQARHHAHPAGDSTASPRSNHRLNCPSCWRIFTPSASTHSSAWAPTRTSPTPARSSASMAQAASACLSATTTSAPIAKSVEQRKQYVDHVRKMFVLAGEPEGAGRQRCRHRDGH